MQLTLDDEKTKALLTEVLIEMLQQKREVFYDIILDALKKWPGQCHHRRRRNRVCG
jgi:hypothetical protein